MVSIQVEIEFDELLKIVDQLPDEKKRALSEHLAEAGLTTLEGELPKKGRILGMHPGSIWMSDDFDDPLPDEFWFGDDE
jgi:hypothetical protein